MLHVAIEMMAMGLRPRVYRIKAKSKIRKVPLLHRKTVEILLHASPGYSGCTPAEPYPPGREEASSSFNQDAVILSSFSAFNINSALMDRSFSFAPDIKAMLTRLLIFLTKPPVEVNMNS
jgi:hypothetical protein